MTSLHRHLSVTAVARRSISRMTSRLRAPTPGVRTTTPIMMLVPAYDTGHFVSGKDANPFLRYRARSHPIVLAGF